jgi:alcohol dehydrogenase (cytochrome c)
MTWVKDVQLSRRHLLGTAAAAGAAFTGGGILLGSGSGPGGALAQDAVASPEAIPVTLGGPIPDEFNVDTNWAHESLNYSATRDAKGSNISTSSIDQLGTAWTFPVTASGAFGALTANPSIAGDTIYVQDSAANVYALNKETGEQFWSKMYNDVVPSDGPNGVAPAYGLLFTTVGGKGDVVALDPATGNEVWKTNILGPLKEGITTYPLVFNNWVIVSTIPGASDGFYEGGQRGIIYALNAATGKIIWYFDTTTDNLWGNPTINSGGGFWHPPSVDADGQIYVPIANPAPYPGVEGFPWGASRPGDNLYTDCVLKMDPATAHLAWYYQINPHDLFDGDNQLTPILAEVNGQKLAIATGKHGIVVALDRDTGDVVWKTPVGTHSNDDIKTDQGDKSISVAPGTLGGVETQPALSVANNLMILPVYELPTPYIGTGIDPAVGFDFSTATGILVAINITDGSIAWQTKLATGPVAGATIANDVVFSAGLDGVILGFNVKDGSRVFKYQATAGINAMAAVSGDYIYFPAGGPLIPSSERASPAPDTANQVIALKIGGQVQPVVETTPGAATPVS